MYLQQTPVVIQGSVRDNLLLPLRFRSAGGAAPPSAAELARVLASLRLDLHRDLLWGTVRTVAQLAVTGYVLRHVFRLASPWPVLLLYWAMVAFAAAIVAGRLRRREARFLVPAAAAMLVSDRGVIFTVTAMVVQVHSWWAPRYFIPLGGMVAGNAMNAVAVAPKRLLDDLHRRWEEVEMHLSLGATAAEVSPAWPARPAGPA